VLRSLAGGFEARAGADAEGGAGAPGWPRPLAAARESARPVFKALAATVTLGTGASLGPEGPSVEIGKAIAKGVSRFDPMAKLGRLTTGRMTSFVAAGAAAGVAAGFNAAISGVFFAFETVLAERQRERARGGVSGEDEDDQNLTVVMLLIASVFASAVVEWGLSNEPAFRVPKFVLRSPVELPLYLALGALCGGTATLFSLSGQGAKRQVQSLRRDGVPGWAMPALGGLLTGAVAVALPEVQYQGFYNVNAMIAAGKTPYTGYTPALLGELVLAKILTTAVARETGQVGGVFAPAIFMGAAVGTGYGLLVSSAAAPILQQMFWYGSNSPAQAVLSMAIGAPQSYSLVGVAAMLASVCRVPLTSILLVFELTRNYTAILPAVGAVGISYYISTRGERLVADYFADLDRREAARKELEERTQREILDYGRPAARRAARGAGARAGAGEEFDADVTSVDVDTTEGLTREGVRWELLNWVRDLSELGQGAGRDGGSRAEGGERAVQEALRAAVGDGDRSAPLVAEAMRRVLVVEESEDAAAVLGKMERGGGDVAVVVGEGGAVVGVVSLADVRECTRVLGAAGHDPAPGKE